jgi:DNA-binding transcriptional ArsR family regulator
MNVLTKVKKGSSKNKMTTLTVEHLASAIRNSIDKEGMPEEEALSMARHVMNFFGYSERIIDNVLEPEDRDAFYMLEDAGILTTEREETTLYDGREWRIHYWIFRKERIAELLGGATDGGSGGLEGADVYNDIPQEIWSRE